MGNVGKQNGRGSGGQNGNPRAEGAFCGGGTRRHVLPQFYERSRAMGVRSIPVEALEARALLSAELISANWGGSGSVEVDGIVYGRGCDVEHGGELWRTDGAAAGTAMVRDLKPGPTSGEPRDLVAFNGAIYFLTDVIGGQGGDNIGYLWRSDGTASGTEVVFQQGTSNPLGLRPLFNAGQFLFFDGWEESGFYPEGFRFQGHRTFISDGTAAGTRPLIDAGGQALFGIWGAAELGGVSYLAVGISGDPGDVYLYRTDGTPEGTQLVKDIRPGPGGAFIGGLRRIDGRLYFTTYDMVHGPEWWVSDGATDGTLAIDLNPDPASSDLSALEAFGPGLVIATEGANGPAYYRSDGTLAGTVLIKAMDAGSSGHMVVLGDQIVLWEELGTGETRLWLSDGTAAGTTLLKTFLPYQGFSIFAQRGDVTSLGGTIYFSAAEVGDGHGWELWKTDGTPEGTLLAADIQPGPADSFAGAFHAFGDSLLLQAWDQADAYPLWKYTPPGETPVGTDVTVTPDYFGPGEPPATIVFNDIVEPGATSVSATTSAPALPAGFEVAGTFYDVSTTAVLAPGAAATLTFEYDETEVGDETQLRLLHYENGAWADVTIPDGPDADLLPDGLDVVSNTITGRVTTFSPFAVVRVVPPPVITVQIQVKSGTTTASVNLASEGVIPVTVFSTATFDARSIDAGSVLFADAHAIGSSLADADGDGDLDLMLKFRSQDTSLRRTYAQLLVDDQDADGVLDSTRQMAEVFLRGRTVGGQQFEGWDGVNLFLSGRALRDLLDRLAADGVL